MYQGLEPIWLQFSFLPGFLSIFSRFLSRSQRFVGQVSSFCFRRCIAYGEALEWYHSSPRFQSHGQFDDPSWVEPWPQRPPRSTHVSCRGGILLSFQPCGRSTYARRPSRAMLGWMGAHPRETLMSVRTLHVETSHVHALRVAGSERGLCCL